ncbi:hypothetical protein PVAP13_5KG258207 [Panicum virgatum]|uniref:Uncharacterized protein n=1 Tax=Panicum virgatum TaxID=38727 RepID=A0A8T0SKE7_PANVG|nr:hypothetical protein PVAP13_5KG258207 [Panicum virgatum]
MGHYIADCPKLKNKEEEEKKYKEKSKDFKKKYQGRAHVGEECESSHEGFDKEGMASLAMSKFTRRLFNNISDDEDDTQFCLMAIGNKVQQSSSTSSHPSSTSSSVENDFENEEKQHDAYMIKELGKKGFKEIKKLMEKLEKKKDTLDRQEDLPIQEKERNFTLEKSLAEEKAKIEKLSIDLSLANDSNKRLMKESTMASDSLASLKATNSELQDSLSSLTIKYKGLEVNYNVLWESTKINSKAVLDSNISTSEGCSNCYKIDIHAYVTNFAKLEELVNAKDLEIKRLNMIVKNSYEGNVKPKPKVNYKDGRYPTIKDRLGHYKGAKVNERKVVKGKETLTFTKGGNLGELMDMAHRVTPLISTLVKKKVEAPIKNKSVTHERSPSYTTDYMVTMDHNGKIVIKYVGAYTKKILRSVWVPKMYPSNLQRPNSIWVPKFQA